MLNRRKNDFGGVVPILCVCVLLVAAQKPADKETIPADFKIVARYCPGFSVLKPWRCTITNDGKVTQEVFDIKKDSKTESSLSEDDVRSLVAKVKEAQFFELTFKYLRAASRPWLSVPPDPPEPK